MINIPASSLNVSLGKTLNVNLPPCDIDVVSSSSVSNLIRKMVWHHFHFLLQYKLDLVVVAPRVLTFFVKYVYATSFPDSFSHQTITNCSFY